jgi:hypothetical protein
MTSFSKQKTGQGSEMPRRTLGETENPYPASGSAVFILGSQDSKRLMPSSSSNQRSTGESISRITHGTTTKARVSEESERDSKGGAKKYS